VNGSQSGRVGDVVLTQRKIDFLRRLIHQAAAREPIFQIQNQSSDPLLGGPAPEINDKLIGPGPLLDESL
jgi:hypothetical protein